MTSSPIRLTSELVPFEQPSSPVHFEDEEMPQREDIRQAPLMEELIDAQNLAEVQKTYIWGTTVTVKDTYNGFRNFLEKFKKDPASKPHYLQILEQMKDTEITNFNLDCQNLYEFERDHVLYYKLINYPQEVIPIFDMVVHDLFRALFPEVELRRPIQVRTFNLKETRPMRELNPEDIDKLISVKGMIIRHSNIIPDLKTAFFKCVICEKTEVREVDRGRIVEPNKCPNCQSKGGMALIHNRGLYSDKQVVKLQETPESIPEGGTPQTVNLAVYDDLVDVTRPGDRIRVTGIYRAQPVRTNQGQRAVKHVYRTYIDVIHFHLQDAQRTEHDVAADDVNMATSVGDSQLHDDTDELDVNSEEKINKFRQFGQLPDVYERLVKSFAPSIHELDDIKKGILCQLFGGTNKKFAENSGKFRGEINVLLCGDPGMSKSQLLQYVHKIAPRGIYTSGKGSSAVGLTAYITKDPDTGEAVLESGALVLSDRGICCIDEFDKMSDQTRAILHEAMEQQTVSVAKAGIICSLNARTAILASANPRDSKYNPNLSVVDNIQLPPTLLSRFDLIYLILDKPDPNSDRKLARHLVSLYFEDVEEQLNGAQTTPDDHLALAPHELKQYIAWARKVVQPQLSDEALEALVEGYVQLRRVGGSSGHGRRVIAATPRQLEGLIRLSEALAKMNLSNIVTARHVTEALRLTRLALLQAATDPRSGLVDIDLITTGRSAVMRARVKQLANEMKALLDRQQAGIKYDMLYNTVQQQAQNGTEIPREDFEEALHMLLEEESITISGNDKNKTIRRVVQG